MKMRREMRFVVMPVFLSFCLVDFIYKPDLAIVWFGLRLAAITFVYFTFELLKNSQIRNNYSQHIAIIAIGVCSNAVNVMIWQSGGIESLYPMGVILICTTGISFFRLSRSGALASCLLSYMPTVAIFWLSIDLGHWQQPAVLSGLMLGMAFLTWLFRTSEDDVSQAWANARVISNNEISRLRKTEFLKKHFPKSLREKIENQELDLSAKNYFPTAVVGFADITSSTQIGNSVSIDLDWDLKERFLESATKRATQCGLIVLTHLGDGFLFLANYNQTEDWSLNIISFYEYLLSDFDIIKKELSLEVSGIDTGVKVGIAAGPAIVGFIGSDQSYFTAMGPDVNLAARLVGRATNNELVVSSRVWYSIKNSLVGWNTANEVLSNIKGFSEDIPAVRIKPRTMKKSQHKCIECGLPLVIVRNANGFFDFSCINGHEQGTEKKAA